MNSKISKLLLLVLALATVTLVASLYLLRKSGAIQVISPLRGPAVQAVYATGTVEPVMMLAVAPRASSTLMALLVDEGSRVTKGALLARLDDADIQEELTDAEAKAVFAQKEYNRQAALMKNNATSRHALDEANTAWQSAHATVEKIKTKLNYMSLRAPDDGTVIRRDGEIGELIDIGQPVFWLAGNDMRVAAEVDEEDIALVKPGQQTLIRADAFPGEVFKGEVESITPKGDPVARSYRVRISLPLESRLMTGMTAETNIIIRENQQALLAPATALREGMVWVVINQMPEKRAVTIGAKNTDMVEIISGLAETELIIKNPSADLEEGKPLKVHRVEWQLRP